MADMFGRGPPSVSTSSATDWKRPDPPRLNDTSALVRKGTYPWQLNTTSGCKSLCEMPFNAENTFNKKAPTVGVCGPYGAGAVLAVRERMNGRSGRSPDGNATVPTRGSSLSVAVQEIGPRK